MHCGPYNQKFGWAMVHLAHAAAPHGLKCTTTAELLLAYVICTPSVIIVWLYRMCLASDKPNKTIWTVTTRVRLCSSVGMNMTIQTDGQTDRQTGRNCDSNSGVWHVRWATKWLNCFGLDGPDCSVWLLIAVVNQGKLDGRNRGKLHSLIFINDNENCNWKIISKTNKLNLNKPQKDNEPRTIFENKIKKGN